MVPEDTGKNIDPINEDKLLNSGSVLKKTNILLNSLNSARTSTENNKSECSSTNISIVTSGTSEKSVTRIEDDEQDKSIDERNSVSCPPKIENDKDAEEDNKEESWSTNSFSDINFTNIEKNVTENNQLSSAMRSSQKSFKAPQQSSTRKEVSHILNSPSSVELNISDSSVFSSHSNCNVSDHIQSDQSLFNDSFTLHLTESDKESSKDSGVKELNKANISNLSNDYNFLDNAFSGSFDNEKNVSSELNFSNDILTCSIEEDASTTSRKRKNSSVAQNLATPSKKKKIYRYRKKNSPSQKEKNESLSQEQLNSSYIQNKLTEEPAADFSKFDIIDVCAHESLLDLFSKELKQKKCFSLSLACSKITEKRPTIGMNIIKPNGIRNELPEENKFCSDNRKVDGFALTWDGTNVFYLSLSDPNRTKKIIKIFKTTLSQRDLYVRIFDSKEQVKLLHHCFSIHFKSKIEDPKVADWILEPEGKEKNLQAMVI